MSLTHVGNNGPPPAPPPAPLSALSPSVVRSQTLVNHPVVRLWESFMCCTVCCLSLPATQCRVETVHVHAQPVTLAWACSNNSQPRLRRLDGCLTTRVKRTSRFNFCPAVHVGEGWVLDWIISSQVFGLPINLCTQRWMGYIFLPHAKKSLDSRNKDLLLVVFFRGPENRRGEKQRFIQLLPLLQVTKGVITLWPFSTPTFKVQRDLI